MMIHRYVCVALVSIVVVVITARSAVAAQYEVLSCKEGVRERISSANWQHDVAATNFELLADCSTEPITLRTLPGTVTPYGAGAGLTFTAPAPLSIVGLKYRMILDTPRSTDPNQPWRWEVDELVTELNGRTYSGGGCSSAVTACSKYIFNPGWQLPQPVRARTWVLRCVDETRTDCAYGAKLTMFDAVFEIDDSDPPQILTTPTGATFAGGADIAGDQTVGYEASDNGSGLYRAAVEIDGAVVGSATSSNTEYPHCERPFRVVRPCPSRVVNGITFSTSELTDGAHEAVLRVYDATEKNVATYGPVRFTTANRQLGNFCGDDELRLRSNLPTKPLRFGHAWRYRARVNDAVGQEVVLLQGRERVTVLGKSHVSPAGRLSLRIPRGMNRLLRVAVRPIGATGMYRCSRPRWLRVKAKVRLLANPEEVTNGRAVRLGGRVLGQSSRNRSVVVQARAVGSKRWATVRVVRTRRDGRFSMKYRFLSTFRTVTYIFRAQVRAEKGYPYATGSSRVRRVRVYGS